MPEEKDKSQLEQDMETKIDPEGDDASQQDDGDQGGSALEEFMQKKGFENQDEIVNSYQELEGKYTQANQKSQQYGEWYPYAISFSNFLKSNPNAMNQYKAWADGEDIEDTKPETESDQKEGDEEQVDVKKQAREAVSGDMKGLLDIEKNRIVNQFDDIKGLSNLPQEQYQKVANAMGVKLRNWGVDLNSPNPEMLKNLPSYLNDAYDLAKKDLGMSADTETVNPQEQANQAGRIGSIPSNPPDTSGEEITEESLSNREREIAKKMGLTPKKYAERKKKQIEKYQ